MLPSWLAFVAGAIPFLLCYYVLPWWLHIKIGNAPNSVFQTLLNQMIEIRFINGLKGTGIACLIVGIIFTILNWNSVSFARRREVSFTAGFAELLTWFFSK